MAVQEEHTRADVLRNRAALLDAAADVLASAPEASLAEIATRAGLTRATLYRHFESRDALLSAIQEEVLRRASEALAGLDLAGCDTREGIRRAAAELVPLALRFRILLAGGASGDPAFLAAREQVLAPLWAVLDRGVEAGELPAAANPAWLRAVLAGLLMTAARAAGAGLVDPGEASELVASTFLEGFGRGGPGA
ncbi:TetR/AcrR family transcriptional regulator [Nocardioides sp.]|uniref:TetR/AcrR family transcriptional regulator n=1 Tax=Nocardioides sp. TaxID=35761 RepID=UPI0025E2C083|nr:TetR/AcrR family transcriptional regulator [Nocardioides sp.]